MQDYVILGIIAVVALAIFGWPQIRPLLEKVFPSLAAPAVDQTPVPVTVVRAPPAPTNPPAVNPPATLAPASPYAATEADVDRFHAACDLIEHFKLSGDAAGLAAAVKAGEQLFHVRAVDKPGSPPVPVANHEGVAASLIGLAAQLKPAPVAPASAASATP